MKNPDDLVRLVPVDPAEAQIMIGSSALSTFFLAGMEVGP
jgi:hypothetical protein